MDGGRRSPVREEERRARVRAGGVPTRGERERDAGEEPSGGGGCACVAMRETEQRRKRKG